MAQQKVGQAAELIRFKVKPEKAAQFVEGRKAVDAFVQSINGYEGATLFQVGDADWLLMIVWADHDALIAAQKITADAAPITAWIASTTEQFVSFESAAVKYASP